MRSVLALMLLVIAVSPVTQNIWSNDNFLHGQDTETTLVFDLTLVSLSLLQMERSSSAMNKALKLIRKCLASLFSAGRFACFKPAEIQSPIESVSHNRFVRRNHPGYKLPLLI